MNYLDLGSWLPDNADFQNPGLETCTNAIPAYDGYKPFQQPEGTGNSVDETVLSARRFDRTDGIAITCVGTTADLYVVVGDVVTASSLSLSATGHWTFQIFGQSVYATCKGVGTYYLPDIDTDTAFEASPGTDPSASAMARVGDFLIMGDLSDTDSNDKPFRLRWSPFNNPQGNWETNLANQSSFLDMPSRFGPITGLSGGDTGLILQKYGVHSIRYVGGATAFARREISDERGCVSPLSVVDVGRFTFWVATDGFCRSDGANVDVISAGRIWDWFKANANMSRLSSVQGVADWPNRCVVWAFPGADQSSLTGLLLYNWERDKWSYVELSVACLVESVVSGRTLESLDSDYSNLDTMGISLDSEAFRALGRTISAFVGLELSEFTGGSMRAIFETGDYHPFPGYRTYVSEVTPITENPSNNTQVAIGTRNTFGEVPQYTSDVSEGALGFAPVVADGRFMRFRLSVPPRSNWTKAKGMMVPFQQGGRA